VTSHRCEQGAHTCVRYVRTKLSFNFAGHAGINVVTLDLGRLRAGDYRLTATPSTSPATPAARRSVSFTVR
jgi:hypothetical protein